MSQVYRVFARASVSLLAQGLYGVQARMCTYVGLAIRNMHYKVPQYTSVNMLQRLTDISLQMQKNATCNLTGVATVAKCKNPVVEQAC